MGAGYFGRKQIVKGLVMTLVEIGIFSVYFFLFPAIYRKIEYIGNGSEKGNA